MEDRIDRGPGRRALVYHRIRSSHNAAAGSRISNAQGERSGRGKGEKEAAGRGTREVGYKHSRGILCGAKLLPPRRRASGALQNEHVGRPPGPVTSLCAAKTRSGPRHARGRHRTNQGRDEQSAVCPAETDAVLHQFSAARPPHGFATAHTRLKKKSLPL